MADLVLYIHFLYVLAVIIPIPLIAIGAFLDWKWIRRPLWRRIHLAMIFIVLAEALVGIVCPLTELEAYLRKEPSSEAYPQGFISQLVSEWLFYNADPWIFTTLYAVTAGIICFLYWKIPPKIGPGTL